ncbi:MAG: FAD-dependent oxidoreductase [Thermoleophilaceae bacterium]|nr:FAD-dependent oxidoreductase [Thermoleophilaceae bacterium]MDQ3319114.1 FAD-binding oxidoreductase [Actinomycetota bacterium]MDQ3355203.1 FAD-binding oxidoreductase [Actinomycetota bacterium]
MTGTQRPDVAVVGAGVIGLTTAIELAERGLVVQVRTRSAPSQTTSAVASAMVGPSVAPAGEPAAAWERASIETFTTLASVPGTGVALRRGRLAARASGPPLPGFEPCALGDLPEGFGSGFWATLPLVDMPVYLDYLVRRLEAADGRIEFGDLHHLTELAEVAPLLVNCAGLGARELVPDPTVRAVRGQQVIVDNPGLEEFFVEAPFSPSWAAYWPYPDHVVLGGTRTDGDETLDPDPDLAEQILQRCIAVEPRLRQATVRAHQVGLRPARPAPRLEAEQISGARCVHNYGHGGGGVTLSWGCAREAASLLTG